MVWTFPIFEWSFNQGIGCLTMYWTMNFLFGIQAMAWVTNYNPTPEKRIRMFIIQIPTVWVSNQEIMWALPEVPERLWPRRDLQRIWEPLVLGSLSQYQPNFDWSLMNWWMKWIRMVELVPIEILLRCVRWFRLEDASWNWNRIWNFCI